VELLELVVAKPRVNEIADTVDALATPLDAASACGSIAQAGRPVTVPFSNTPALRAASESNMICRALPRKITASGANVAWPSGEKGDRDTSRRQTS